MSNVQWEAPLKEWFKACFQWAYIGAFMGVMWLLTYFPMGMLVAYLSKPMTSPFNEPRTRHKDKYIAEGSSGWWDFWSTDLPILKYFTVYEDGSLGEPSGKHSARVKGKERTWWAMYQWITRNPVNYMKRTSRILACYVNDATLTYWGDREVSDKESDKTGSYLIKGVDKITGRTYYGYRKVFLWDDVVWYSRMKALVAKTPWLNKYSHILDNRLYHATFGYKIRPTHIGEIQDEDDLDKAFTFRVQFWAVID